MLDAPCWATDGRDWPNRHASRFVEAGGLTWHVQQAGAGPVLLLLHGTGAATHSWAGLLPRLTGFFTVVAPDLPGHGFTGALPARRMSPTGMAQAVAALLDHLRLRPDYCAGHSAGAAILARMCLDGCIDPAILFSLNGALVPLAPGAAQLLMPLARLLSVNRLTPRLFAFHAADRRVVERLLHQTGSDVPAGSVAFYGRLARRAGHAGAALAMMAHWDLPALWRDLPRLKTKLVMISGDNDRTIAPQSALRVQSLLAGAEVISMAGLGHLAHEEAPDGIAEIMIDRAGLIQAAA